MAKASPLLQKPFFAPPALRQALAKIGLAKSARTETMLFRQGDPPKGVYLLESGKVALTLTKGKTCKAFWIAEAGSVLGLPSTVRNQPYSLSAKVIEPAQMVFLSRTKFRRLLLANSELCFTAVQILGAELRSLRLVI
jgi:CRP-like cAMP-binding protein